MQEGFIRYTFVKMIYVGIVTLNNAFKLNFVSFLSCPNGCHTKKLSFSVSKSSNLTKVDKMNLYLNLIIFFIKMYWIYSTFEKQVWRRLFVGNKKWQKYIELG